MRHELSAAVSTSAPEATTSATLSVPIATEVSGFLTEKVPPNPQQASGFARSTRSRPSTRREQPLRPVAEPEQALGVAGRVKRHPVRVASTDVDDAEDVDQVLREIEHARCHGIDGGRQVRVKPAGQRVIGHGRVVRSDHRRAGRGGGHHGVEPRERVHEPAGEQDGVVPVPGVEVDLTAAGLAAGKHARPAPAERSTRTVAAPTSGNRRSLKQATNSATRFEPVGR